MTSLNVNQFTTEEEIQWIEGRARSLADLRRILRTVRLRWYAPPCRQSDVVAHLEGRIEALERVERRIERQAAQ